MRYFKVIMSSGDAIPISSDELPVVIEAVGKRLPAVVCQQGIFNSAFYVEIVVDKKREQEVMEMRRVGMKEEIDSPFVAALEETRNKNKLLT